MYHHHHYCNNDGMRLLAEGMAYAMTEFYLVFRKSYPRDRGLFIRILQGFDDYHTVNVRQPKITDKNWHESSMRFKKECIALIDNGYSNGKISEELADVWRNQIAEYQMQKNEVWE